MESIVITNIDLNSDPNVAAGKLAVFWQAQRIKTAAQANGSLTIDWPDVSGANEVASRILDANSQLREAVATHFNAQFPGPSYIVCGVGVCGTQLVAA